jgi:Cof subfamily protein (haloacid dehalogenase superfamily)
MSYKIIVLDLDGTLTNSQKKISTATKAALTKAQQMGIKVVLASGRPTAGIEPIAKELEIDKYNGYIISFNGGKLINYTTNEVIYETVLPMDIIPSLYATSQQFNVAIASYGKDTIITETPNDPYVELEAKINKIPLIQVDSFTEAINFTVPKCLMFGEGNYLGTVEPIIKEKYKETLNIYRSEPYFLEILPKNIDKAFTLSKLLEHLKLTKQEMIACGDGFNDLTMIQYAGLGVAMENAQEIVKDAADYITLSNDDDGIVHVLEKYVFN